jgi:hypothetical protein
MNSSCDREDHSKGDPSKGEEDGMAKMQSSIRWSFGVRASR